MRGLQISRSVGGSRLRDAASAADRGAIEPALNEIASRSGLTRRGGNEPSRGKHR